MKLWVTEATRSTVTGPCRPGSAVPMFSMVMTGSIVSPGCILAGTPSPMARSSGNGPAASWTATGLLKLPPYPRFHKLLIDVGDESHVELTAVPGKPGGTRRQGERSGQRLQTVLRNRRRIDGAQLDGVFHGMGSRRDDNLDGRVRRIGGAGVAVGRSRDRSLGRRSLRRAARWSWWCRCSGETPRR